MSDKNQDKTIQFEIKKDLSIEDALMFATHYHKQGELEQAKALYEEILKKEPQQIDSLHNLGLLLCQQNQFEAGLPYLQQAVHASPQNIPFYLTLAQVFKHLEQFDQIEQCLKDALAHQCDHIEIYYWLGESLLIQHKFEEAREVLTHAATLDPEDQDVQRLLSYLPISTDKKLLEQNTQLDKQVKQILKAKPTQQQMKQATLYNHEAAQAFNKNNVQKALQLVSKAIQLNPKDPGFYNNRGIFHQNLGQAEKAIADYLLTIALDPQFQNAYNNLGQLLNLTNHLEEAFDYLTQSLHINPNSPDAHNNIAIVLQRQGKLVEAKNHLYIALKLKPDYAEAYNNLGILFVYEDNYAQAESEFKKAILFQKNHLNAHLNLSRLLIHQGFFTQADQLLRDLLKTQRQHDEVLSQLGYVAFKKRDLTEAERFFNKSLAINPNQHKTLLLLGVSLDLNHQTKKAISILEKAYQLQPIAYLKVLLFYFSLKLCQWDRFANDDLEQVWQQILEDLSEKSYAELPEGLIFWLLSFPYEYHPLALKQITLALAQQETRGLQPAFDHSNYLTNRAVNKKLRIGYVSSDMNNHTVGEMTKGIFKRHDKDHFEIYIYSTGKADNSLIRKEIMEAVTVFHDVQYFSANQIATLIHQDEIDILVDLNNWTEGFNPRIFAYRPAPVQITWGGTPSTTGLTCIDYILIDKVVAPVEDSHYYTEKLVYLPDSHIYANQDSQIAENVPSRTECHLPDSAFVFCCFCNHYKIEPMIFDIWMSILRQEPNSVLWLLGSGDLVNNLKNEAEKRGVDPERLIFAPRKDHAIYLAQYRNADLFLDTYFMTGAATTCDALWAGLPVLTCLGQRYGSRVSASALNAIKLPELIVSDLEEYEERALFFARHPEELLAIREKVETNRLTTPLFDTDLLTQNIEQAYLAIWDRHQQGLTPDMIDLTAQ